MKKIVLYPADYYDMHMVDDAYKDEYDTAISFSGFVPVLFNYDAFLEGKKLKLYPETTDIEMCIYRGWMMNDVQYERFYGELLSRNIRMINTPEKYRLCHLFPNAYSLISKYTPKSIWFEKDTDIDYDLVKTTFKRFMIKDYVKSVKGTSFPKYFESDIDNAELCQRIEEFIGLRSSLYTGGIVFKEFVHLKLYDGTTNEYRAFFCHGKLISLSRNSNQSDACSRVNEAFVKQFAGFGSDFYTVDFAELSDGRWIIIETGDGQVSGLSPGQNIYKFYEELNLSMEAE